MELPTLPSASEELEVKQYQVSFSPEMITRAKEHDITFSQAIFDRLVKLTQPGASDIKLRQTPDEQLMKNRQIFDNCLMTFDSDTCCLWKGSVRPKNQKGVQHGIFPIEGQTIAPHRLMYIICFGLPIDITDPKNLCPCGAQGRKKLPKTYGSCCRQMVLHKCKEITGKDHDGACVNPLHLKLGTAAENQHDIRVHSTGKGGVKPGETAYQAKMTDNVAKEIRNAIQEKNTTLKEVAIRFGVSYNMVKDMSSGKSWNSISGLTKKKEYNKKRIDRAETIYQEQQ
jgi:hypothetical protein